MRTPSDRKSKTIATAGMILAGFIASPALAVPLTTCAALGSWSFRNDGGLLILSVTPGDVINIAVEDFVGTFSLTSNGITINPSQPYTFTATLTENVELSQVAGGAIITCTQASSGGPVSGTGALLSGNSQTNATQTGVSRNTQSRFGGGGGNTVNRNGFFISTQNLPQNRGLGLSDRNFWGSLETRLYAGTVAGWSGDLVGGVDWLSNADTLFGVLGAYNRMSISTATASAIVDAPAVGAYFARRARSGLFMDGFLSVARPRYQTQGTSFMANRVSMAFSLTTNKPHGNAMISPYLKMKGFSEWQPAYTGTSGAVAANAIRSFNVSAGVKWTAIEARGPNDFLPYVSVAADYGYSNSTAAGTDVFFSPRFGIGFGMRIGKGALSVDIDAGRVRADTSDFGARATYELSF